MPIEFVAGDLFANTHAAQAFAHGCNCQGSMGAGIAVGFRERYPEMYEQYRAKCKAKPREFNLGDVWLWKGDGQPWVFNLGTQEKVWRARATYEAVEQSLSKMRELADAEGVTSIAIPRIGVGYGGLSWKKVRVIVERVFSNWPSRLIVYEEFVPAENVPNAQPSTEAGRATPAVTSRSSSPGRVGRRQKASATQGPEFTVRALTIACTDSDRTVWFYRDVLGASVIPTDNGIGWWFRLGSLEINLLVNALERSPAEFSTHAMPIPWLEVSDLSAAAAWFERNKVDVIDPGDGQYVQVADPDGLVIEVWQREFHQ